MDNKIENKDYFTPAEEELPFEGLSWCLESNLLV